MKVDRRTFLKFLLGVSAVIVVAPLTSLAEYLNIPYKFEPKRERIEGAESMVRNSSLAFLWPTETRPLDNNVIIRDPSGGYQAFNRVCTHLQCLVNYDEGSQTIVCPCHGSIYDAKTGTVVSGPAPKALPKIDLEVDPNGDVYATDAEGTFGYGRD